ncbi:MAG: hypothetical protein NZL89_00360 [Leptospiraceae bacterium]|nr:hypothetical protein [Leptospiraceae bacterium]
MPVHSTDFVLIRMTPQKPPAAPLRRQPDYDLPRDGRWARLKHSLIRFVLRRLGVPHDVTDVLRSAFKLGNPTETAWPAETLPMNARIFAAGFWNYSFFQFNRKFLPPLWAAEQYNPASKSFLPRSHNILSLNQTQRNWVAIGFPGRSVEASVDMAGSIMVWPGSYSIEFATLENGKLLRPQDEAKAVELVLHSADCLECRWRGLAIQYQATPEGIRIQAQGKSPLLLSVRPFNVEGPALLYRLSYSEKKRQLSGDADIFFEKAPDWFHLSSWKTGDALRRIVPKLRRLGKKKAPEPVHDARDPMGLVTAAFYFSRAERCEANVFDHRHETVPQPLRGKTAAEIVTEYFGKPPQLKLPKDHDEWFRHAREHLIALWDYDSIKPGSYTYHHFWIRDAVIMLYALLLLGAKKAVRPILEQFPGMVGRNGLFRSQTGEWDANGQALWILGQYVRFTQDYSPILSMRRPIARMLDWIEKSCAQFGGVLPPGFSAEHLGPADWYLWDNFWTLGGLQAIAPCLRVLGLEARAKQLQQKLTTALKGYLSHYSYYPAALGRGKDAGMIGSIAAIYPLQLAEFCDSRMLRTLELIRENYFFRGCFFQENIHSGLNPYLTLQMAESYLFFGRTRQARQILRSIRQRAQKAYTFPEAIHVRTGGGCMGDGFHGWASAESVIMIRNLIVRETQLCDGRDALVWLSGFRDKWLADATYADRLPTPWSYVSYRLKDYHFELAGLSAAVTNVLSLPQEYTAIDARSGKLLPEIRFDAISAANCDERRYFLIDASSGRAEVILSPTR